MFLREVLPRVTFLAYCELFYQSDGQDTGYVPETAIDLDGRCRIRAWNADLLTSLSIMDHGITPTNWQRDQHPELYRGNISVVHEGIDVQKVTPDPAARFAVPGGGPTFKYGDEVVTYVARDLEPVRGFTLLMRALPELLRLRPNAQIVICGGDGVSYGRPPTSGDTWKTVMLRENALDGRRVHFVGKLARGDYLRLLQVSALHLYLSVPFVLSWSCIEAMAVGCLILASDVAPVREAIEDGRTGFLIDARDARLLATRTADLLADRHKLGSIRQAARDDAVGRFDFKRCLVAQTALISRLTA
jgi:glycosyltransferase involved in cell wall biosynthesis